MTNEIGKNKFVSIPQPIAGFRRMYSIKKNTWHYSTVSKPEVKLDDGYHWAWDIETEQWFRNKLGPCKQVVQSEERLKYTGNHLMDQYVFQRLNQANPDKTKKVPLPIRPRLPSTKPSANTMQTINERTKITENTNQETSEADEYLAILNVNDIELPDTLPEPFTTGEYS
jgi:hypothetical protein